MRFKLTLLLLYIIAVYVHGQNENESLLPGDKLVKTTTIHSQHEPTSLNLEVDQFCYILMFSQKLSNTS